ncbi:hypothetical protein MXB_4219 [Myxobolus squamalis]|nr:hypothetical protein MXB_4219 [Myxobolus squamalis]
MYKLSNLNRPELLEKYKVACQYSQADDWDVSVHYIAERTISKILKTLINKYEIKSHLKTHLVSDISTISDLILKYAKPIETDFDFSFLRLIVKTLVWSNNLSDKNIVTQIILANLCIYVSLLNVVPNQKVVKTSIKFLMKIIEIKSTNLEENFQTIIGLNILRLILSSVSWDKMNQIIIKSLKGLVKKLISTELIDIYTEFPTEMLVPSNFFFFVLYLFQHVKYVRCHGYI